MSPAILSTLFILRWFNDVPHRTEYAKLVAVSLIPCVRFRFPPDDTPALDELLQQPVAGGTMIITNDTLFLCISRCVRFDVSNPDHRLEYAKLATAYWAVLTNREDVPFDQRICMSNIRAWESAYAQSHNLEERW